MFGKKKQRETEARCELRKGNTLDDQEIGVPWFTRAQWVIMQEICTESCLVGKRYGQWLAESKGVLSSIRNAGIRAQKVDIDARRLAAWCLKHDRSVTSGALADYVNICLQESPKG